MRSKEEILQDKFSDIGTIYFKGKIFEAMDEYASEVLRDKLGGILNFISDEKSPYAVCYGNAETRFATNNKDLTTEEVVNEYLRTKD